MPVHLLNLGVTTSSYHISAHSEKMAVDSKFDELMKRTTSAAKMYGAQLVWRIDNVAQKINEAKVHELFRVHAYPIVRDMCTIGTRESGTRPIIHSEPFVSGRHGYKFIASAYLFGDGQYRGKYLSVYLTLVRGKYDPLLVWPFDLVVCITLLDQVFIMPTHYESRGISVISTSRDCKNPDISKRCDISYRVDPKKIKEKTEFLERPLTDKNGSFGAQAFCRLEVMENYIKDDAMFLQVEVNMSNEAESISLPAINKSSMNLQEKPPLTPDTHSVTEFSTARIKTPLEDWRPGTEMKLPDEEKFRPATVQKLFESRPSTAHFSPAPISLDGLQPVNGPQPKVHAATGTKNVVAPMPGSVPIVVSEKSEISEMEVNGKPRPKT
ncbi:MATH domain protein [Necator americanus]|uniref:MATH domain protein n=1 Tax=Necator americanus TaxID=51031 RepID=W2SKB0_NECAM|nr:MATH domain protein [Necator americanus]ETN69266.1 MATH domain protein [Necator americanus]